MLFDPRLAYLRLLEGTDAKWRRYRGALAKSGITLIRYQWFGGAYVR